ncbi:MAG: DegT/DnrJ/EryC1/StrS family aminotransferase [Imperialibacter sp.]|uniref:DegT/DnrJ/EryC1/StrS family aminotransferase n=1 Tax=Imperialibacter sp. TaxID=2038411 RepID=UPI0032EE256E
MMSEATYIPHFTISRQHQKLRCALDDAYDRVLSKNWFVLGEEVKAFEKEFGEYLGVKHCIGCGNGTDALELSLRAAGIKTGDEVVVPANTWVSVAESVINVGASPVFADALPGEYTIDPASVQRCISKTTKAIIVVHQYGQPAHLNELLEIRDAHKLVLIEDCAHAHGAVYQGKNVGTSGDFGCFSFYPTKNLGCLGDGGAVVTDNDEYASSVRLLGNHGQHTRNVHKVAGRNSRLHELQAAFLRSKLPMLDQWNTRRRSIATHYMHGLDRSMYRLPSMGDPDYAVFHQYVIQTDDRENLIRHLDRAGVGAAIHYPALINEIFPYQSFRTDPEGLLVGSSEKSSILSLPMFPELADDEVQKVIHTLNNFRG